MSEKHKEDSVDQNLAFTIQYYSSVSKHLNNPEISEGYMVECRKRILSLFRPVYIGDELAVRESDHAIYLEYHQTSKQYIDRFVTLMGIFRNSECIDLALYTCRVFASFCNTIEFSAMNEIHRQEVLSKLNTFIQLFLIKAHRYFPMHAGEIRKILLRVDDDGYNRENSLDPSPKQGPKRGVDPFTDDWKVVDTQPFITTFDPNSLKVRAGVEQ